MARLAIALALLIAACAAATEEIDVSQRMRELPGRFWEHPDFPKPIGPIAPAGPCGIKNSQCVPAFTETDARKLSELGYTGQVAVVPDEYVHSTPPTEPQRKASCRNGGCHQPLRKGSRSERSATNRGRMLRSEQAEPKQPRAQPPAQ